VDIELVDDGDYEKPDAGDEAFPIINDLQKWLEDGTPLTEEN